LRAPILLLGAVIIAASVVVIYNRAAASYFVEDDFHWLAQTQVFNPVNLLDLHRYSHFYRPVIEVYFYAGLSAFGCDATSFHVASIVIHLLATLVLFLFARAVSESDTFGLLSAAFFAVQPGYTDAVAWVGAITDLLPALFYLLTLWLHLLFLRHGGLFRYAGVLAAFTLCHLTHESAATLLPMMAAVELTFAAEGNLRARLALVARHWPRYAPFAVLLAAYLVLAYVVNSRSYLVSEGYYAFGWHALPNIFNYVIGLYIGRRVLLDYTFIGTAIVVLIWWGSPRLRFFVLWIVLTLMPVAFFTWGNQSRYLYLPAAGFAMLLADLVLTAGASLARWMRQPAAKTVAVALVAALAIRFGVFAKKGADSFPQRTAPYERFVSELRRANPAARAGDTVYVDRRFAEGVPELYRVAAARVGLCLPEIRLQLR